MPNKTNSRGGWREGAGRPAEMVDPVRITVWLERSQVAELKQLYGDKWAAAIRGLIDIHFSRAPNKSIQPTQKAGG